MAYFDCQAVIKYLEDGTMPFSGDRNQRSYMKRKSTSFVLKNKQLFHKRLKKDGNNKSQMLARVLISREEITNAIKLYHCGTTDTIIDDNSVGHRGFNRTQKKIAQRFWWPNMTKDIKDYIRTCPCHPKIMKSRESALAHQKAIIGLKPWEKVGIHLHNLAKTKRGNMHMLIAIDYFSKWIEVRPMKTCSARDIVENLLDIFCRCGFPKLILSHQRPELVNSISKDFFASTGVQLEIIPADDSHNKNPIEKANQTIMNTLIKVLQSDTRDWDCILSGVIRALLTTKQRSTKFTPWMLMWGREPDDIFTTHIKEEMDESICEDSNDEFNDVIKLKMKGNRINHVAMRSLSGSTQSRRKSEHKTRSHVDLDY